MKMRVGFIGLGTMGYHMAAHLTGAGYDVVGFDIVAERVDRIVTLGALRGASPQKVAEGVDVVITMLPNSPDVELVALGEDGICRAARSGLVYVDMSTIAPSSAIKVARVLEGKGVQCLDAPVSGGQVGAEKATLSIMVGGPRALFDEMRQILATMGSTITYCGPHGAGQTVKACNQIQVALSLVGMAEALVLGAKAGVDPEIIIKVFGSGFAQTRVVDVRGPRLIRGDFSPGFMSKLHYKDLGIGMDLAKELGVPLPGTALARQLFGSLLAQGHQDLDHSAVIKVLEGMAGVRVRVEKP